MKFLTGLLLLLPLIVATPASASDTFDGVVLTVPVVKVGNQLYTNVHVTVLPPIVVTGGTAVDTFDTYDPATNRLNIASVVVNGVTFTNVAVSVGDIRAPFPLGPFAVSNTKPVLGTVNPMEDATVGTFYSRSVVGSIYPTSLYTFSIDTLANGTLPTGMTINQNGVLSGTPFATGKADVDGTQLPNPYTFGVCATDTISRFTTSPCPQTTIIVNPLTYSLTINTLGSGTVSANPAGLKYAPGKIVTLTPTPNAGSAFGAWTGACTGSGACSVTMSANKTVTATFVSTIEPTKASISATGTAVVTAVHPGSASFPNSGWKEYLITITGTVSGPVNSSFTYPTPNYNFFIDTWKGGYTPNSPTYRNSGDAPTANFTFELKTSYDDVELPVVWKGTVGVQAPPSYSSVTATVSIPISK